MTKNDIDFSKKKLIQQAICFFLQSKRTKEQREILSDLQEKVMPSLQLFSLRQH